MRHDDTDDQGTNREHMLLKRGQELLARIDKRDAAQPYISIAELVELIRIGVALNEIE